MAMDITAWTEKETAYCVAQLSLWRKKTFREQEAFIEEMKMDGALPQEPEEIRMRITYLDRLTNGELSNYELLTIPESDRKLNGACKKS